MDAVSLTTFLKHNHNLTAIVFPTEAERYVNAGEVIPQVIFEGRDSSENTKRTADFFIAYMNEMDSRTDGKQNSIIRKKVVFSSCILKIGKLNNCSTFI